MSVVSTLQSLMDSSDEFESWIRDGIRQISKNKFMECIHGDRDAAELVFQRYEKYMSNPVTSKVLSTLFKKHWETIERIVTDPDEFRSVLVSAKPSLERELYTDNGDEMVVEAAQNLYDRLYEYTWE